jgi:hypothetical protein
VTPIERPVAGICLISTQGDLSAFRCPQGQEGVRWGTATGALIASYTVVDGYGVKMLGHSARCTRLVFQLPAIFNAGPSYALKTHSHVGTDEKEMVAGDWGWSTIAAVIHSCPHRSRLGSASQPGGAGARDVDDGGSAVWNGASGGSRERLAHRRLPRHDPGRSAACASLDRRFSTDRRFP